MIQIISTIGIIACWLAGGQWEKSIRRYGISSIIIGLIIWKSMSGGIWWSYIPLILLCPELFLGYGTGSWAADVFKKEWAIRAAYATALAIPIILCGLLQLKLIGIFSLILLNGAFQIRAGRLFKMGKKDFLIEDFFRSLALSISLWLVL
jgi:hypothetical protein